MIQEDYWCVKIISTCIFPTLCLMNMCVHTRQRELIVVGFASLIALVMLFLILYLPLDHSFNVYFHPLNCRSRDCRKVHKYHELLKCVVLSKVVCVHSKCFSSAIFLKDYCSFLFQPSEQNNPNFRIQNYIIHFKPLMYFILFLGGWGGDNSLQCLFAIE